MLVGTVIVTFMAVLVVNVLVFAVRMVAPIVFKLGIDGFNEVHKANQGQIFVA